MKAQIRKRIPEMRITRQMDKPTFTLFLGLVTTMAEVQAQSTTDLAKAVARLGRPGCGRTTVHPQRYHHRLSLSLFRMCQGGILRRFLVVTMFRSLEPTMYLYK